MSDAMWEAQARWAKEEADELRIELRGLVEAIENSSVYHDWRVAPEFVSARALLDKDHDGR